MLPLQLLSFMDKINEWDEKLKEMIKIDTSELGFGIIFLLVILFVKFWVVGELNKKG